MHSLQGYWAWLPTWAHWLGGVLLVLALVEGLYLGGRRLLQRFWTSRIGAFVHQWWLTDSDWNSVKFRNLDVDAICAPWGGHALVYDEEEARKLNPHALSMSGYCARCRREWRRDPQGLRDGWTRARRPDGWSLGMLPTHPTLASPPTLAPIGKDDRPIFDEPATSRDWHSGLERDEEAESDYAEEESPEIDPYKRMRPRRGWNDLEPLE